MKLPPDILIILKTLTLFFIRNHLNVFNRLLIMAKQSDIAVGIIKFIKLLKTKLGQ